VAKKPVNLKKAPRREIREINRIGSWGRVEYHHVLDCGHVEVRKRAASAGTMACSGCVLSEEYESRVESRPVRDEYPADDVLDALGSQLAINEGTAQAIKVELAKKLQLTQDAVEVALEVDEDGVQSLSGAVVLLSADEVLRFIG